MRNFRALHGGQHASDDGEQLSATYVGKDRKRRLENDSGYRMAGELRKVALPDKDFSHVGKPRRIPKADDPKKLKRERELDEKANATELGADSELDLEHEDTKAKRKRFGWTKRELKDQDVNDTCDDEDADDADNYGVPDDKEANDEE
jgi:hypothetical protein